MRWGLFFEGVRSEVKSIVMGRVFYGFYIFLDILNLEDECEF